jgi:hypothetical protein
MVVLYRAAWIRLRLWHSELALSQINKTSPDVPALVLEVHALRQQLQSLGGQS